VECADLRDRVWVMTERLKSCQLEVTATEQIVRAKEDEARAARRLIALADREKGRLRSDISPIESKASSIRMKGGDVQSGIFKAQERIRALKTEAQMNQQQLDQWIQAAQEREDDFSVLKRYQTRDEGQIRS
jgi:chromosome segregation ATPase